MSSVDLYLQALPNEIFDIILQLLEPLPLVRLSSCSRPMRWRLQQDYRLWRILYLRYFDRPLDLLPTEVYPWRTEFENFFSTWRLLRSLHGPLKAQLVQSVTRMISMQNPNSKASLNLALLKDCFTPRSIDHVTYLRRSALHQWTKIVRSTSFATGEHVYTPPDCWQWTQFAAKNPYPQQTTEGHLSARLHCLYGPCVQAYNSASPASFWTDPVLAACARSRVYDARAYSQEGKRGPFFEGSGRVRVDWAQVEALLCILTVSYQRMVDRSRVPPQQINRMVYKSWQTPFAGLERRSCKQSGRNVTGEMGIAGEDPYGISGSWPTLSAQLPRTDILIKYCRASLAFPPTQTGPPLFLREYDQKGAMELRVTKIQPRQGGSRGLPTVEMVGTWSFTCRETGVVSRHLLEGQVSPTEDGEIRWSIKFLVSLPVRRTPTHPEMHCTIEGVQIGGPNTARGVVGMMFPNVAGDSTCPCPAPFAFWKGR